MSVGDLYRPDSLKTAEQELAKCKSDPIAVQEVKWDRGDTELLNNYTLFM
jgi:hypothetical protein